MKQDVRPSSANRHATGREKLRGHLAMLLFAVLIAGSFSFGGMAAQFMEAEPLTLWRYLMTSVVMGIMAFAIFRMPTKRPRQTYRFAVLGGLIAIYMLTMFTALEYTDPVSTGAVFTLMPLLSAGFALVLLGQTTRPGVLGALVLAALGALWVIFRGDPAALLAFDVGTGELIFFVGVVCHAAYVPLIRRYDRGEHPLTFAFWVTIFATIWLSWPGTPGLVATDFLSLPLSVYLAVFYLSVVTTAFTFLLLQYASMRLPAPKVLAYGYLTPSFIILVEGLLGHGWASPSVLIGALMTAGGLGLMALLPD
ncbi:DMT family transporter [Rhizobium sp. TRM95111]|uniref:DMT family transporter n=1 Tax=Rhizobium alarense TaxID=2846851 RepID=UPI001F4246DE|nr:DMT family transporter [Rhizobium alarense]MCF3641435.1 DMT family transporter [Rhizobium alarense]